MDPHRPVSAAPSPAPRGLEVISSDYFVPDHVFVYVGTGELRAHDGRQAYVLRANQYCLVRKNHLVSYDRRRGELEAERTVICLEEQFLKAFQHKHQLPTGQPLASGAFVPLTRNKLIPAFIRSLQPYYANSAALPAALAEVKYEELLLLLLRQQPELAGLLFAYGPPGKLNLEAFMHQNFRFNISAREFAYLTGRSLSAFKRDFQQLFHEAPGRWLVRRRLQEAHFLIAERQRKPADFYLELGFEDLSHFSFAFRRQFGYTPKHLAQAQSGGHR